ncbi:hypothetical protein PCLA_02r0466 [Pseudomonas citronellolis]|nr:hypothetical protein PCLA_02r0466 [Pseudomonas citronellolis]
MHRRSPSRQFAAPHLNIQRRSPSAPGRAIDYCNRKRIVPPSPPPQVHGKMA